MNNHLYKMILLLKLYYNYLYQKPLNKLSSISILLDKIISKVKSQIKLSYV